MSWLCNFSHLDIFFQKIWWCKAIGIFLVFPYYNMPYVKSFSELWGSNFDKICGMYTTSITKNLHIHQSFNFFPPFVGWFWQMEQTKHRICQDSFIQHTIHHILFLLVKNNKQLSQFCPSWPLDIIISQIMTRDQFITVIFFLAIPFFPYSYFKQLLSILEI